MTRRTLVALLLSLSMLLAGVGLTSERAAVRSAPAAAATNVPLTNLSHLNWLGDTVTPPPQARHTTYRLADQPSIGVLWTYADRQPDGSYKRVGGGAYDATTNTYGQGAFNADDMSRAAVVYLRHWQQTGSTDSRQHAYGLLRGLTYLQTATGPNQGNVVLWMQPDGTLQPERRPRSSCPTRPTATRPTGWRAPSGRSARATPPSARPTRRSPPSCAPGSTWPSPRSTVRCSTPTAPTTPSTASARRPG